MHSHDRSLISFRALPIDSNNRMKEGVRWKIHEANHIYTFTGKSMLHLSHHLMTSIRSNHPDIEVTHQKKPCPSLYDVKSFASSNVKRHQRNANIRQNVFTIKALKNDNRENYRPVGSQTLCYNVVKWKMAELNRYFCHRNVKTPTNLINILAFNFAIIKDESI